MTKPIRKASVVASLPMQAPAESGSDSASSTLENTQSSETAQGSVNSTENRKRTRVSNHAQPKRVFELTKRHVAVEYLCLPYKASSFQCEASVMEEVGYLFERAEKKISGQPANIDVLRYVVQKKLELGLFDDAEEFAESLPVDQGFSIVEMLLDIARAKNEAGESNQARETLQKACAIAANPEYNCCDPSEPSLPGSTRLHKEMARLTSLYKVVMIQSQLGVDSDARLGYSKLIELREQSVIECDRKEYFRALLIINDIKNLPTVLNISHNLYGGVVDGYCGYINDLSCKLLKDGILFDCDPSIYVYLCDLITNAARAQYELGLLNSSPQAMQLAESIPKIILADTFDKKLAAVGCYIQVAATYSIIKFPEQAHEYFDSAAKALLQVGSDAASGLDPAQKVQIAKRYIQLELESKDCGFTMSSTDLINTVVKYVGPENCRSLFCEGYKNKIHTLIQLGLQARALALGGECKMAGWDVMSVDLKILEAKLDSNIENKKSLLNEAFCAALRLDSTNSVNPLGHKGDELLNFIQGEKLQNLASVAQAQAQALLPDDAQCTINVMLALGIGNFAKENKWFDEGCLSKAYADLAASLLQCFRKPSALGVAVG